MKLELRYPATADNALDHAQLAVEVAYEEFGVDLDYSPGSLEAVDAQVETLREDGLTGEGAAEALFVLGCYVGEVMAPRTFSPAPRPCVKVVFPAPRSPDNTSTSPARNCPASSSPAARMSSAVGTVSSIGIAFA